MSDTMRWVLVVVAALLVVAMIAFARGGEERGAETTSLAALSLEV